MTCRLVIPLAKTAGDKGGASDAEEHAYGHEKQEYGSGQRDGGNHQGILGLTDEYGVGQIIEHDHQHTDDGRYDI